MQGYPPPWIAVLSIIYWVSGIYLTLSGLSLISAAIVVAGWAGTEQGAAVELGIAVGGILCLCVGAASCAVGSGLWGLKAEAWSGALTLAILWALASLASSALLAVFAPASIAVWWPFLLLPEAAILGALFWPTIREPFVAPRAAQRVHEPRGAQTRCVNPSCRRALAPGWNYCPHCLTASVTA